MPEVTKGPFIHKFETKNNKYLYDVNTLNILRVDPVVWDIVGDVGRLELQEIVAKHTERWSEEQIRTAHQEIREAQERQGLFVMIRPQVSFRMSLDDVKARYVKRREILILNVTERCNFACAYCGNHQRNRLMNTSHPDMSWDVAKKAIDQFMPEGSPELTAVAFYGGEPLLNFPLIKRCVNYIRQMDNGEKVHLGVTTNGSLLTDEKTDFLTSQDVAITVSLDGPRELHDRYRRTAAGEPTWDLVTGNIQRYLVRHEAHYRSGRFGLSVVMVGPLEIRQLQDFFTSFCIDANRIFSLSFVDSREAGFKTPGEVAGVDSLHQDFLEKLRVGAISLHESNGSNRLAMMLWQHEFLILHRRHEMRGARRRDGRYCLPARYCSTSSCVPGTRRTFVNSDGDLWPCERTRHTEFLKIGNIHQGIDFAAVRQKLADWVEVTKEDCQDCWCLHGCQVGCFADAANGEKPTREQKLTECRRYQEKYHRQLVEYCSILEDNPHAFDYMEEITVT